MKNRAIVVALIFLATATSFWTNSLSANNEIDYWRGLYSSAVGPNMCAGCPPWRRQLGATSRSSPPRSRPQKLMATKWSSWWIWNRFLIAFLIRIIMCVWHRFGGLCLLSNHVSRGWFLAAVLNVIRLPQRKVGGHFYVSIDRSAINWRVSVERYLNKSRNFGQIGRPNWMALIN